MLRFAQHDSIRPARFAYFCNAAVELVVRGLAQPLWLRQVGHNGDRYEADLRPLATHPTTNVTTVPMATYHVQAMGV